MKQKSIGTCMSVNILHVIYISKNVTLVCGNLHWKANGKCLLCLINNAEYEVQMAKDDQEATGVRVHKHYVKWM